MTYVIAVPDGQIDDVLNLAAEAEENGQTAYPGATFEQGVSEAIRWLTGDAPSGPPLP